MRISYFASSNSGTGQRSGLKRLVQWGRGRRRGEAMRDFRTQKDPLSLDCRAIETPHLIQRWEEAAGREPST